VTYRLLPRAEADIEEIGDYISRQNPGAALRLIETFMRRWNLLALYPLPARRSRALEAAFAMLWSGTM